MTLRDYFEQRAREGSWGSLYEGSPQDERSYNFVSRRGAVARLLPERGTFARALDIGCGTGDYAALAARCAARYCGVDFAAGMAAEARRRARAAGLDNAAFAVGAGEELPFADGSFDLVLGIGYIAYFADPRAALAELRRVLQPGGTLVLHVAKADLVGRIDRAVLERVRASVRGPRAAAPLPDGWVNVQHGVRRLDAFARAAGFLRVARTFDHFHLLPAFLRRRRPRLHIALSERLSKWPKLARAFAVNYVARYELRGK
jgi:SAM-dependent methyltransferase